MSFSLALSRKSLASFPQLVLPWIFSYFSIICNGSGITANYPSIILRFGCTVVDFDKGGNRAGDPSVYWQTIHIFRTLEALQ